MHWVDTKKRQKFVIFLLAISALFVCVILSALSNRVFSQASSTSDKSWQSVAYTNVVGDYDPDPNYATPEYWDEHYHGEKHYLDSIAPGTTLNTGDYFINKPIVIDCTNDDYINVVPLTINGKVNIYFEKSPNGVSPILNIIANKNATKGATPGILLPEGSQLYFQGKASVNVEAGADVFNPDNNVTKGQNGGDAIMELYTLGYSYGYPGRGGQGGNGTKGAPAAIGTKGGDSGKSVYDDSVEVRWSKDSLDTDQDGTTKDGSNGGNGKTTNKAGKFMMSGNVDLHCNGGVVQYHKDITRSEAGTVVKWQQVSEYYVIFSLLKWVMLGFGSGGGNGGYGFPGAAIGTGGSGGSAGGNGGFGGTNIQVLTSVLDWYGLGGAGGPGTGSQLSLGGGGPKKTYVYDENPSTASDFDPYNPPSDEKKWCLGTKGSYETGSRSSEPRAGNGGKGGISEVAGTAPPTLTSLPLTFEGGSNLSDFLKSRAGNNSEQYMVYPEDEIEIKLLDSINPTGYYYQTDWKTEVHPKFEVVHTPTGRIITDEVKNSLNIVYENVSNPGQPIIDECKAKLTLSSKVSVPGNTAIIGKTIEGGEVSYVFEYEVVDETCRVSGVIVNDKKYDGKPIVVDDKNLKIFDLSGWDVTDQIEDWMIIKQYYSIDSKQFLDSAPVESGNYSYVIKIEDWWYKCSATIDFKITKNTNGLKIEVKNPKSIYGDVITNPEETEIVVKNCITGEENAFEYNKDYKIVYNVSDLSNAGVYSDGVIVRYLKDGPSVHNYEVPDSTTQSYKIEKRPGTIKPNKIYTEWGAKEPALTVNTNNIIDRDALLHQDYVVYRDSGTDVGSYAIYVELTSSGKSKYSENYDLDLSQNGWFIIEEADVELILDDGDYEKHLTWGDNIEDVEIHAYARLVNDTTKKHLLQRNSDYIVNPWMSDDFESNKSDTGIDIKYYQAIAQSEGPISKNVHYVNASQNIIVWYNARQTKITLSNMEKTYGDSDPDLQNCQLTLINPAIIDGKPEVLVYGQDYTLQREAGENAGTYKISLTLLTPHYSLQGAVQGGVFTILKRSVNIDGKIKIITESDDLPNLETIDIKELCTVTGFLEGQSLPDRPTFTYSKEPQKGQIGVYPITISYTAQTEFPANYVWGKVRSRSALEIVPDERVDVDIKNEGEAYSEDLGVWYLPTKTYTSSKYPIDVSKAHCYVKETGEDVIDKIPVNDFKYVFYKYDNDEWTYIGTESPKEAGIYELYVWITASSEASDENGVRYSGYKDWYFKVEKADATITPNSFSTTYSGTEPELQGATLEGFLGDDAENIKYKLSKKPGVDVRSGEYEITAEVETSESKVENNYNIKCESGWCKINKKSAVVTLSDDKQFEQTYGDEFNNIIATTNDFVGEDQLTSDDYQISIKPRPLSFVNSNSAYNPVGSYDIICDVTNTQFLNNYSISLDPNTPIYNIVKRSASITANNQTAVYGEPEKSLTVSLNNIVDDIEQGVEYGLSVNYEGQVKDNKDVGTYDINVSLLSGAEVLLKNYNVELIKGNYSITKKEIYSIKVKDLSNNYGDGYNFEYVVSPSLVEGDNLVEGEDFTYNWEEDVSVGDHAVSISIMEEGPSSKNYNFIERLPGNFHVNKKSVTVEVFDYSAIYGEEFPEFSIKNLDLAYGEHWEKGDQYKISVIDTPPNGFFKVGDYGLKATIDEEKTKNYAVTTIDGVLTINKRRAYYSTQNCEKTYGSDDPAFTAAFDNLVPGDEFTTDDYILFRDLGEYADYNYGIYALLNETEITKNYIPEPKDLGYLHINRANAKIIADSGAEWTYGAIEEKIGATVEGLKFDDELIPDVDYVVHLDSNKDAGVHNCTPEVIAEESAVCWNYNFECIAGQYRINIFDDFDNVIIATIAPQEYTGNPIEPKVNVSYTFKDPTTDNSTNEDVTKVFEEGKDFKVTYSNNINPGTAEICIDGIGSCSGTTFATFEILGSYNPDVPVPVEPIVENIVGQTSDDLHELAVIILVVLFSMSFAVVICTRKKKKH